MKQETLMKLVEGDLRYFYKTMKAWNVDDPQELVHELLVMLCNRKAYLKIPENMPKAEFRKWFSARICYMAKDAHLNTQWEREHLVSLDDVVDTEEEPGYDDNTYRDQLDLAVDLEKAFRQFEEPFRSELRAVLLKHMTFQDVADQTGEPLSTISARHYRARVKLQAALKDYDTPPTNTGKEMRKNSAA